MFVPLSVSNIARKGVEVKEQLKCGYVGSYIHYPNCWEFVCDISKEAALKMVKKLLPGDLTLGGHVQIKDLTVNTDPDTDIDANGWISKFYVVILESNTHSLAVYNRDGVFSIYISKEENT